MKKLYELLNTLSKDDEIWICDERGDYIYSGKIENMPSVKDYDVLRYYEADKSKSGEYEIVVDKDCF